MKKSAVLVSTAVLAALLSLLAPAAAHATNPKKGGVYKSASDDVIKVNDTGKKIKKFFIQQGLNNCSPVPFDTSPVKPAIKKGAFVWKGSLENMIGDTVRFTIKGTFSGTGGKTLKVVAIDNACHDPKRAYKLKAK